MHGSELRASGLSTAPAHIERDCHTAIAVSCAPETLSTQVKHHREGVRQRLLAIRAHSVNRDHLLYAPWLPPSGAKNWAFKR